MSYNTFLGVEQICIGSMFGGMGVGWLLWWLLCNSEYRADTVKLRLGYVIIKELFFSVTLRASSIIFSVSSNHLKKKIVVVETSTYLVCFQ